MTTAQVCAPGHKPACIKLPPPPPPAHGAWKSVQGSNKDKAALEIPGYKIMFERKDHKITIENLKTGEKSTIWGDPHLDWTGDGKAELDFFETTSFNLENGVKMTVNTKALGNGTTVADKVVITDAKSGQSAVVDGLASGKELRIKTGHNAHALDQAVPDGILQLFENPGKNAGWLTGTGRLATMKDGLLSKGPAAKTNPPPSFEDQVKLIGNNAKAVKDARHAAKQARELSDWVTKNKDWVESHPGFGGLSAHAKRSWYELVALVLGGRLNEQAKELEGLANRIEGGDDQPGTIAQMNAAAQKMGAISNQVQTILSSLGEANKTLGRMG
jgi:hypothetical protein